MSTKLHFAKPDHEVAYQDVVALVQKHADKLNSLELLAVAANMLGKMVALQDGRVVSPEMAMEIVARNLEHGNKQVIDKLAKNTGRVQ